MAQDEIKDSVKRQFGATAANYVTSLVHAKGSDLPLLPTIAGLTGNELVLDVATAVGHTALAIAPHAGHVIGVDLTPEMLVQARQMAQARGLTNLSFVEGDAEHLPFPDGLFDLITCRIAAHHFPNLMAFLHEARRVLKPGGLLLVVDNVAPEADDLDAFINTVEKLRDPSHFREHKLSEWARSIAAAGLGYTLAHQFRSTTEMSDWLARMQVEEERANEIRRRFAEASLEAKATFGITATHFQLDKAIMLGRRPI